ncbi:mitochondrial import inner membrane translocase subunit TIM14 [Elasticomyces elasticus]|nr:mitochondrial import inner membrane translocase subunit TIM14 [Elasticomyces elasticus]
MATALAIGAGVAVAAFFGRAGLVALRRSKGGVNALGKAFYKGGFEAKMNRREAALILETSYGNPQSPILMSASAIATRIETDTLRARRLG